MKKLEYLKSFEGLANQRLARWIKRGRFIVKQEPQSKNSISNAEKKTFRDEIKNQLNNLKKRQYRGNIVLKVSFTVTKRNAPSIHTLTKNYLDLLHKKLDGVDSHKEILFKDDSQIKILIVNYQAKSEGNKGEIYIQTQSIGDFIKDLEFINNTDIEQENIYLDDFDTSLEGLNSLEDIKDVLKENYDSLKNYWTRQVQENFLKLSNVNIMGLISLFRSQFHDNNFDSFVELKKYFAEQERLIIFSTNFLELGQSPNKEGSSKSEFKGIVREKLKAFREKYKILFPLLQPIRVNIFFIPPKSNVADLDNVARYIIPFVNETFEPPSNLQSYLGKNYFAEENTTKLTPPNSISSYQIITIPRKETDDENGYIFFVVSEGFFSSDLWSEIDEVIDNHKNK